LILIYHTNARALDLISEPIQACVIGSGRLTPSDRAQIAQCLGFHHDDSYPLCRGAYEPIVVEALPRKDELRLGADKVAFNNAGRSVLAGHVNIAETNRILNADTAYVYRDAASKQITRIELLGGVRLFEPGRLMIARQATIVPGDKSGLIDDVLYRFDANRAGALLPAWGRALRIERFPNENYRLQGVSYTNCAPEDRAWHLEAKQIDLDTGRSLGVARHAKLYLGDVPVLYTPYLSFPTSKERKSGFLFPIIGSTNVGGLDVALPYYWNIAPNYDLTLIPHGYSKRGLMMGEEFRYLTEHSLGQVDAQFLPRDRAYADFLRDNQVQFPELKGDPTDRWSVRVLDHTNLSPNLQLDVNVQQVSDDYFLEDFSTNLAILTERQLVREGQLRYSMDNWLFLGMVQSYQTLQPINATPVADIYRRLPQLVALGNYQDLPFNSTLSITGQFDNFAWPNHLTQMPDGPRYYLNPVLSLPMVKSWGYLTPSVELVANHYDVHHFDVDENTRHFQDSIPRYAVDAGLFLDRQTSVFGQEFTQTLEPRLYYLNVPFRNQTPIPVYDSAYMIFNVDQLFRTSRFSGFDRIGDANQLAYALSSRWISDWDGRERASVSVGQLHYFSQRRVGLCQSPLGSCVDNPLSLGYLSQTKSSSPFASRAVYHFNPYWLAIGDYVWDPATEATNNGHVDLRYQSGPNRIVGFGYTYLISGDITQVGTTQPDIDPLHQLSFSYAWPYNDHWSSLGAFSYNISKKYEMMSFLGLQYDSCCWAMRLIGGRSFMSLGSNSQQARYNNNVFLQLQLKGLGSVANNDPGSLIRTFLPEYRDSFRH